MGVCPPTVYIYIYIFVSRVGYGGPLEFYFYFDFFCFFFFFFIKGRVWWTLRACFVSCLFWVRDFVGVFATSPRVHRGRPLDLSPSRGCGGAEQHGV